MSFNFATCRRVPPNNFFPNPPSDGSKRPWSRAIGFQCLNNFTNEQLDMRRKAEILKYKNNNANLSKKQIYSRRARGIGVEQKSWGTQPFISGNTIITSNNKSINGNSNLNIRNLQRIENILICPSKKNIICNPSSNSNVPGNKELCYDKSVPLVDYKEELTYSKIGTTWPQRSWEPGDKGFPVGKIGSLGNIYYRLARHENITPIPPHPPELHYFYIYTNWVLVNVLNSNTYSDLNTALKASIENNNSTGVVFFNNNYSLRYNYGITRWHHSISYIKYNALDKLHPSNAAVSECSICLKDNCNNIAEHSTFWDCNNNISICTPLYLTSDRPINKDTIIFYKHILDP